MADLNDLNMKIPLILVILMAMSCLNFMAWVVEMSMKNIS